MKKESKKIVENIKICTFENVDKKIVDNDFYISKKSVTRIKKDVAKNKLTDGNYIHLNYHKDYKIRLIEIDHPNYLLMFEKIK